MCHFRTIKDAADVAIATMLSGIQVRSCVLYYWSYTSCNIFNIFNFAFKFQFFFQILILYLVYYAVILNQIVYIFDMKSCLHL